MKVDLLNFKVDPLSKEQAVEHIFACLESRCKVHVVYINALKVYQIDKNPKLKKAIDEAELALADGVPIVWVSRLFKKAVPERVNGTDLFERLLADCETRAKSVYFLGARQDVLQKMVDVLRAKHPSLRIAGYRNGYFKDREDELIIQDINASNADILFLGFSSPKKEIWANRYKDNILCPVIKGVGGSFDVVAGEVRRAPRWMQEVGLEWFYRVLMEPNRMLVRYLKSNSYFLRLVFKYYFANGRTK